MGVSLIDPSSRSDVISWRYKALGLAALFCSLTIALLTAYPRRRPALPLAVLVWALAGARGCTRACSPAHATRLLMGVRWAGKYYPGRVACFEVSLGACIAGIFIGRMPVWCLGTSLFPIIRHSWIEAAGRPVNEPDTLDWPYEAFVRV